MWERSGTPGYFYHGLGLKKQGKKRRKDKMEDAMEGKEKKKVY